MLATEVATVFNLINIDPLFTLMAEYSLETKIKNIQVLQQETYPAIWRPVDAQNSAIPGAIPQYTRGPARDQAEPPCKISRRSAKPRLRNP